MKTRKFLLTCLFILCVTLVIAALPTERDSAIYEDTIRLHIRARSDSDEDQRIKLEIRDRLLEGYSALLSSESRAGAELLVAKRLTEIESEINEWLCELSADYTASVSLGREWFSRRDYGEFTLPEGEYTALVVELGGGEGQNWWCVMYPPMCLDIATEPEKLYTEQERGLILGRYQVRFKLLELASELSRRK